MKETLPNLPEPTFTAEVQQLRSALEHTLPRDENGIVMIDSNEDIISGTARVLFGENYPDTDIEIIVEQFLHIENKASDETDSLD